GALLYLDRFVLRSSFEQSTLMSVSRNRDGRVAVPIRLLGESRLARSMSPPAGNSIPRLRNLDSAPRSMMAIGYLPSSGVALVGVCFAALAARTGGSWAVHDLTIEEGSREIMSADILRWRPKNTTPPHVLDPKLLWTLHKQQWRIDCILEGR